MVQKGQTFDKVQQLNFVKFWKITEVFRSFGCKTREESLRNCSVVVFHWPIRKQTFDRVQQLENSNNRPITGKLSLLLDEKLYKNIMK